MKKAIKAVAVCTALLSLAVLLGGCSLDGAYDALYHRCPAYDSSPCYVGKDLQVSGTWYYRLRGLSSEDYLNYIGGASVGLITDNYRHPEGFYVRNGVEEPIERYEVKKLFVELRFPLDVSSSTQKLSVFETTESAIIQPLLQLIKEPPGTAEEVEGERNAELAPRESEKRFVFYFIFDAPAEISTGAIFFQRFDRYYFSWCHTFYKNRKYDTAIYVYDCTDLIQSDLMAPLREALEAHITS